jgi:hypothetical protein
MTIRPREAKFFHTDRKTGERMGMTKLIAAFRNFAESKTVNRVIQYFRPPKYSIKYDFNTCYIHNTRLTYFT